MKFKEDLQKSMDEVEDESDVIAAKNAQIELNAEADEFFRSAF